MTSAADSTRALPSPPKQPSLWTKRRGDRSDFYFCWACVTVIFFMLLFISLSDGPHMPYDEIVTRGQWNQWKVDCLRVHTRFECDALAKQAGL